ncbi:MAG: M13 family metallopeptidase [Acidobacteriia bacterium]|nr:M13 family metallopeptidase [Terriglobia bacterium]
MYYRLILLGCLKAMLAPAASSVDTSAINPAVDPCVDFYQYVCGNWIAKNQIPPDRSQWARFTELSERTEKVLEDLIQTAAAAKAPSGSLDQKIGDYFGSCLDTRAIEKKGLTPVAPELARIRALKSREDLAAEVASLHRAGINVIFRFVSEPDPKNSSMTIAALVQGGLSLPDRDYYLKTDAKSVETRQRFEQHVRNILQLAKDSGDDAAAQARLVLEMETRLATVSLDRVSRRDPLKTYHLTARADLSVLAPRFLWDEYFKGIAAPPFEAVDVEWPDYFKGLPLDEPIDSWKAYLSYHLLRNAASQLTEAFQREDFEFWGKYMTGAKQPRPRPSRCVNLVDSHLGDLLAQKYVNAAFGPEAKSRITELVEALEKAMEEDIERIDWMTPETKQAAIAKLHAITNNVGYPRKWRDYSTVAIARDDFYGNTRRAAAAEYQRRLERIGKPTDKTEWNMTAPTVNAFYSPDFNSINFPAGILQDPFFDARRDTAVNFGAVGSVIGHEMTHGFDDQGRKFDSAGNLRDWWSPKDAEEFEKRAACMANEYSGFTAVDNVKVNGRLTLGENTADNGGVRIAFMALQDTLQGNETKIDGFTPEQRFFLGYGQLWCENSSAEQIRLRALTNPHSPGPFRANGVLQNMPEFQKAFACKPGQPMVSRNACRVW